MPNPSLYPLKHDEINTSIYCRPYFYVLPTLLSSRTRGSEITVVCIFFKVRKTYYIHLLVLDEARHTHTGRRNKTTQKPNVMEWSVEGTKTTAATRARP